MSRTLDRSQGKFEAMPVSEGAPIVESGSNSDGEWTRWADGNQKCTSSGTASASFPFGGLYRSGSSPGAAIVELPLAFINTPKHCVGGGAYDGIGYINDTVADTDINSLTQADVRVISDVSGQPFIVSIVSFGRWK